MFAFLISILTLHRVHSACVLEDICPDDAAIQAEIVDTHNAFRRAVQPTATDMLKMNYSEEVAASAQAWVEQCILAHGPPAAHMLDGYEMGENLFYSSRKYDWADVISSWHSEVEHYQYPTGSATGQVIGHYTQVIWSSSYRVGCGVAQCQGLYYYACHYFRAGNFRGWPPYKEGTSCSACPNHCDDKLCTNPCPYVNKYINCPALKTSYGCGHRLVYAWCPASCKCVDKIIAIA